MKDAQWERRMLGAIAGAVFLGVIASRLVDRVFGWVFGLIGL